MEPNFYRNPYGFYFPNRFGNSYYRNNYNRYSMAQNKKSPESSKDSPKIEEINTKKEDTRSEASEKPIFEIFGIKLFFDDILLISLIFFLYTEGVKDQSLFISLILLLLS